MSSLTAPELYAISQGDKCEGQQECHWCGGPCTRRFTHDEGPLHLFTQRGRFAKRPGNAYICRGCWLWRRKRITIHYLNKAYKDIQSPEDHSWWITGNGAWAINELTHKLIYDRLLSPPIPFCLSLKTEKDPNRLQYAIVNDIGMIEAGTPLWFTINNLPMTYTIYELEQALRHNDLNGKESGVRLLVSVLGPYQFPSLDIQSGAGRPTSKGADGDGRALKKVIKEKLKITSKGTEGIPSLESTKPKKTTVY